MKKVTIYMNHWLELHPYKAVQPADGYYVALANRLFESMELTEFPLDVRGRIALYLSAYLEDQVSGLMLWQTFLKEHNRLYAKQLPFYQLSECYYVDEVNQEDVALIMWNTIQKAVQHDEKLAKVLEAAKVNVSGSAWACKGFVNPMNPVLLSEAERLYGILSDAYEEAPENETLAEYFTSIANEREGREKLQWLFGRTYLTEPSVLPYLANMGDGDMFIVPTGPLALFVHEWIDALGGDESWKLVKGLYVDEPEMPADFVAKNKEIYVNFTSATAGSNIVFLDGYDQLKEFLVKALHWPDDENHTLPQLRESRDFILMVHPEKGMLLAKDICRYLAAPGNTIYNSQEAAQGAFRLLTQETVCPPDLLYRSIREGWIPDVQVPGQPETRELVLANTDFIARNFLLYYYRGD